MAQAPARLEGLVVASHGRHCVVESAGGERRICHPRGKKSQAVVGDRVLWQPAAPGQGRGHGDEGTIATQAPTFELGQFCYNFSSCQRTPGLRGPVFFLQHRCHVWAGVGMRASRSLAGGCE